MSPIADRKLAPPSKPPGISFDYRWRPSYIAGTVTPIGTYAALPIGGGGIPSFFR
jgi:hypothetical protein